MSDEDDTLSDDAVPPTTDAPAPALAPADEPERGDGVRIPTWLAGSLVVVLALVLAGTGFAIGRSTAPGDDERFHVPVLSGGEGRPGVLPFPDPGDLPPGFEPGGPGPRGRLFEDERGDGSGSQDGDQGTSAPPGVAEAVPRVGS